jgi:diacylglycerol kinase family enzyme/membrane-associated phospholipid phosphatase
MRGRIAPTAVIAAAFALVFAVWTWLSIESTAFAALDATSRTPPVSLDEGWGQLMAALSFLLHPVVAYTTLGVLAAWAWRRRLRNLAFALLVSVPLGVGSERLLKALMARERPPTAVPLVTEGFAYPSGHLIGISALALLAIAITVVTRRGDLTAWGVRVGSVALVVLVAYNRWALRAHYFSDIVAGGLWGGFVASFALLAAGVHVVAPWAGRPQRGVPPTVFVVVNPTKVPDWEVLRKHVDGVARGHGWGRPRWLETTEDDPGLAAARQAVAAGADLVVAAGGDGTVRSVSQGLAGTRATLAVLPTGTGNLLARNLGIPLDVADALEVAFDGVASPLDLVEVRADEAEPEASVVMAGMGVDAVIMSETNPDLKRAVGPAAYALSAVGAMSRPPFDLTITLDAAAPVRRSVGLALIANVGQLQGGVLLVPDARPDDGRFDVLFAHARGPAGWAGLAGRVVAGATQVTGLERWQGTHAVFEADEPTAYQVDGDTAGTCRRLEAVIVPRALTVMVPR